MFITPLCGREVNGHSWGTSVVVSPRIIMILLSSNFRDNRKFIYEPIPTFQRKMYWKSDMSNITGNELSEHKRTATEIGRNSWIDQSEGKERWSPHKYLYNIFPWKQQPSYCLFVPCESLAVLLYNQWSI